ncbi:helix-turn-helix domain-containing protein [Williamsia sterculiae]|uniref:AraC-type DNA-binding protein n=1 Tax=Williamsia sterculiae TaxID=1344003 RepID=A0A1N7H2Y2_9NOCA|nr:AraC family transcriptional regulator [Williamsia sterculiae]SIS19191.1 AraC-type DNA-binding protein [Williamsia sterculiae]
MPSGQLEFTTTPPGSVPGASSCVGYRAAGVEPGTHLGVPSASLTFILSVDGPVVGAWSGDDLAAGRVSTSDIVLSGLHTGAAHIVQPSRQEGVQLAVDPLACRAVFGVPVAELTGPISMPEVLGRRDHELWERVGDAAGWEQRFALVADRFRAAAANAEHSTLAPGRRARTDVVAAWRILRTRRGAIAVESVAQRVALSPRQLRTEFTREFGVTPKQAARLMRFEHALGRITAAVRAGRTPSLAGVAADCGYADHAHLTREVGAFLGVTPTEWIAAERRNIQAGGHTYHED